MTVPAIWMESLQAVIDRLYILMNRQGTQSSRTDVAGIPVQAVLSKPVDLFTI